MGRVAPAIVYWFLAALATYNTSINHKHKTCIQFYCNMFCYLPNRGILIDLGPIYTRLIELDCKVKGLYINIRGVDVQFLVPNQPLVEEALENGFFVDIENVKARIFQYEYALAVKAEAGRPKDWAHIATALESATPNKEKLETILTRYGLLEKWRRKIEE